MVSAYNSTPAGLKALNDFLESRSFLEGFSVSQADTFVFNKIPADVDAEEFANVVRWWRHIASYGADRLSFPGEVPAASASEAKDDTPAEKPATASKGDDSDSDSDDSDFEIPESSDDDSSEVDHDALNQKRKEERLAREKEKMAKAKSIVVFDVKPETSETDMNELAASVRGIEMDGLTWGVKHNFIEVCYGIQKLQISLVIVDSKVSVDDLVEKIIVLKDEAGERMAQSVDIQSFNKL